MRPYFLQPDSFWPFMTFNRQRWPSSVTTEFYLSFEDALWSLLPRLGYAKGSLLLFPEFYCPDVLHNIEAHGYRISTYPVNKDLSVTLDQVATVIKDKKPDIFVDFAPAGVPSGIGELVLRKLPFHSLVLLDRVHSVISPTVDFFPPSDRFLLINSYRKVSPFPGSLAVFSRNAHQSAPVPKTTYIRRGLGLWLKYLGALRISRLLRSARIALFAFQKYLTDQHDTLIGDAPISRQLHPFFRFLTEHIAVDVIRSAKEKQAHYYRGKFAPYLKAHGGQVWDLTGSSEYAGELRGFPLIIREPAATEFLTIAQQGGLAIYAQLDDNDWSKNQKLILLPLGPQFTDHDIKTMARIAEKALTTTLQCDIISA